MRGINQIDAHAVKVTEQQSDAPGNVSRRVTTCASVTPRRISGNAGSSTRVSTPPGNLRCRQRADHIRQSTGFNSGNIS